MAFHRVHEKSASTIATSRNAGIDYSSIQSTKPQTVGYALNDSPGETCRIPGREVALMERHHAAHFAHERVPEGEPPRSYLERLYNIQRWTIFPRGGHFSAVEAPAEVADDLTAFFRTQAGSPRSAADASAIGW